MIKEAIEYIVGLGNARLQQVGDQQFSTQPIHLVKEATSTAIVLHSLSGLVDYLKSEFDGKQKLMIHVESPTEVFAYTTFNRDRARNTLIHAKAMIPEFRSGAWHDPESFIIKLQSVFVPNEDRATMLKVVGNIKEENVAALGDDGVSQQVTARTGISTVANVAVPNPVVLAPYRTFVEVEQPESSFVFRMQSGPQCALFEADGGAWKITAMNKVHEYLAKALEEQIAAGDITLIA